LVSYCIKHLPAGLYESQAYCMNILRSGSCPFWTSLDHWHARTQLPNNLSTL